MKMNKNTKEPGHDYLAVQIEGLSDNVGALIKKQERLAAQHESIEHCIKKMEESETRLSESFYSIQLIEERRRLREKILFFIVGSIVFLQIPAEIQIISDLIKKLFGL